MMSEEAGRMWGKMGVTSVEIDVIKGGGARAILSLTFTKETTGDLAFPER